MLNYGQILKFVKLVFDQAEVQRPAAKVLKAVLLARSPRLTDIGRKLSSNPEAGKKYVQRFLASTRPQEGLHRLIMPRTPAAQSAAAI